MPTGIVNSLQEFLILARIRIARLFTILPGITLFLIPSPILRAEEGKALPVLRRVIVLSLPPGVPTDSRTRQILESQRLKQARRRQRPRRRLFAASPPSQPPTLPRPLGFVDKPRKKASPEANTPLTSAQQLALAQSLFTDAFRERLRERSHATVLSEAEVEAALRELHLTPSEAVEEVQARRLCSRLQSDAVLIPRISLVTIRQGATEDVTLWGKMHVVLPSRTETSPAVRNFRSLPMAGASSVGRDLFHRAYLKPTLQLLQEAATQTAALTVTALRTGEAVPLMQLGERVAIMPVTAPASADALLLTSEGRRTLPDFVKGLPKDVSPFFAPDLLPIPPEAIVPPEEIRRLLRVIPRPLDPAIWKHEDNPECSVAQALGRRIGVDYVLMARINEVEVEEERPRVMIRSARAEATGALVRVRDGALLWHDRCTATMSVPFNTPDYLGRRETIPEIIADAERFALLELRRRFHKYRAAYER